MRNPYITGLAAFAVCTLLQLGATARVHAQAPWPTNGWPVSTPALRGLPEGSFDPFIRRIRAGEFGRVNRFVVVYDGWLIVNERFSHDYRMLARGRTGPLGCGEGACDEPADSTPYNYFDTDWHPFHQGGRLHTQQSITKSVTSALIGIAIGKGQISGVRAPLITFLDGYDLSLTDPRLAKVTLADLLTMRSGIEWHEADRPLDETNTALQLERSPDWIRFILAQPMNADPGRRFVYSGGSTQLLSQVIRQATGEHADAYADTHLFRPLGIREWYWKKTPAGHPDMQSGLYLDAEQVAKIGWLYVNNGVWDGQRILPEGWVAESVRKHVSNAAPGGVGYGYQWWRVDWRNTEIWASFGLGGQTLLIVPAHRILAVVNAWNIFDDQPGPILGPLTAALLAPLAERR